MGVIVDTLARKFIKSEVSTSLDGLKDMCFLYAMRSGVTVSIDDVRTPTNKQEILDEYEIEADKVEQHFRRGIITDGERRQQEVEIWTDATAVIAAEMEKSLKAMAVQPCPDDGWFRCSW